MRCSESGAAAKATGRIHRSWRQATIPAPFLQAKGKSYSSLRLSPTYFSAAWHYRVFVSSIPQGLDFSPLPARQRVFYCLM
jgi:hypothetical protein